MRTNRISIVLLLVAFGLLGLFAAGCGSDDSSSDSKSDSKTTESTSDAETTDATDTTATDTTASTDAATATTLKVEGGEMYLKPTTFTAPAGDVTFEFTNAGKVEHELIVLKTDAAVGSLKPGDDGRVSEDESVGEVSETPAGETKSETINLKPGKYLLVCNIPGHYAAGMRATLVVT